jgi:hypothetical protein
MSHSQKIENYSIILNSSSRNRVDYPSPFEFTLSTDKKTNNLTDSIPFTTIFSLLAGSFTHIDLFHINIGVGLLVPTDLSNVFLNAITGGISEYHKIDSYDTLTGILTLKNSLNIPVTGATTGDIVIAISNEKSLKHIGIPKGIYDVKLTNILLPKQNLLYNGVSVPMADIPSFYVELTSEPSLLIGKTANSVGVDSRSFFIPNNDSSTKFLCIKSNTILTMNLESEV